MTPARAAPVERFASRYEVELPWVTGSDNAEKRAALESADVAVCCAKAGVQVPVRGSDGAMREPSPWWPT